MLLQRNQQFAIKHSVHIHATAECVWQHIIDVDFASLRHPAYFALLDIPKPLNAEITQSGVGGARTAYFSNGHRFSQRITAWQPNERYAFTFHADPGFRAAYVLDLGAGSFQMKAGAYQIEPCTDGVRLSLSSDYELRGVIGACLHPPVRLVLALFQRHLLGGIKRNAELKSEAAYA